MLKMNIESYRRKYFTFNLLGYKLRRLACIIVFCGIPFYIIKQQLITSVITFLGFILIIVGSISDLIALYLAYKLDKCHRNDRKETDWYVI